LFISLRFSSALVAARLSAGKGGVSVSLTRAGTTAGWVLTVSCTLMFLSLGFTSNGFCLCCPMPVKDSTSSEASTHILMALCMKVLYIPGAKLQISWDLHTMPYSPDTLAS